MRRVWASLIAVWATLAIMGVLVWTRPAPVATQATPITYVVKGKNGQGRLVVAAPTATAVHATTHVSPVPAG